MKRYEYGAEVQSVSSLVNDLKNNRIDLNPLYQRDVVWENTDFSNFIDSVMMGVASPNITFNNSGNKKTCIDGKQRCTSLYKFVNNEISLERDGVEYYYGPNLENISNEEKRKTAKLLSEDERCQFDDTKLNIIQYRNLAYDDQVEIFTRLQYGKYLTAGEKVLARIGDINTTKKFKEFCESKEKILSKYYKKRNEHYQFITDLMYLVKTEATSPMDKKSISIFLNELKEDELTELINITTKIIDNIFTSSLFNNAKVMRLKISKTKISIFVYAIYDTILKNKEELTEEDNTKLIQVLKDTSINTNTKRGRQKNTIQHILEKFGDNYDRIFKNYSDSEEPEEEKPKTKKVTRVVIVKKKKENTK